MKRITTALGDDERYCTAILGNTALAVSAPAGTSLKEIFYYNSTGQKLSVLIRKDQEIEKSHGVFVKDIRLKPLAPLSPNEMVAELEVQFQKNQTVGPSETTRRIPIYTLIQNGRVKICSAVPITSMVINERLCDMTQGGFSKWDETKGQCVDSEEVKWVTGDDARKVSCPIEMRLAKPKSEIADPQIFMSKLGSSQSFPSPSYLFKWLYR